MICPVCKDSELRLNQLTENLNVYSCISCLGNWIRHEDYWKWNKTNEEKVEKEVETKNHFSVLDSTQAKICPDCGRIIIKYKVDNNLDFYVDHCGNCSGVWLDKNEWENLEVNNLHTKIYSFFTKPWQKRLRDEAARSNLRSKYIKKFGRWDYERLKEMREWIYINENRSEMLSYLIDEDPYKI